MADSKLNYAVAFLVAAFLTLTALSVVFGIVVLLLPLQISERQAVIAVVAKIALSCYAGVRYASWVDRSWRDPDRRRCQACGYILKGLLSNRCPECGAVFNLDEVHKAEIELEDPGNR